MGKAEDWQTRLTKSLSDLDITLFNPRRDDWDSSWVQSIHHEHFRAQVEWELHALELADCIVVYFDPSTQSPITLLELGLHARSKRMVVCCPDGFWRKGNVEIVAARYGFPMVENLQGLEAHVRKDFSDHHRLRTPA